MSTQGAVAVVTQTIRRIVYDALTQGDRQFGSPDSFDPKLVTVLPPDQARGSRQDNQANLYLYNVAINPAWRNQDIPGRARPGESAPPLLPLVLHYMLTFFGKEDDDNADADLLAHEMLGLAMLALHDDPILSAANVSRAYAGVPGPLPPRKALAQVEGVRLTPTMLTTDDLFKLWSGFQTPHRLTVAYEVSVVLIESQRPSRSAPPVLERGKGDRGALVGGMRFALLDGVLVPPPAPGQRTPARRNPGARLGDTIAVTGTNLDGIDSLRFRHVGLGLTIPDPAVTVVRRDPTSIVVRLPDPTAGSAVWAAGTFAVAGLLAAGPDDPPGTRRFTNEVAFPLLPALPLTDNTGFPLAVDAAGAGAIDLPVQPDVRPGQSVSLFLGDVELRPTAITAPTDQLAFRLASITPLLKPGTTSTLRAGLYARLRVDGADSLAFDPDQRPGGFLPQYLPRLVGP